MKIAAATVLALGLVAGLGAKTPPTTKAKPQPVAKVAPKPEITNPLIIKELKVIFSEACGGFSDQELLMIKSFSDEPEEAMGLMKRFLARRIDMVDANRIALANTMLDASYEGYYDLRDQAKREIAAADARKVQYQKDIERLAPLTIDDVIQRIKAQN